MSNATIRTVTVYNGNDIDIVIEDANLAACLAQLTALGDGATAPVATEEKAPDPTPATPAATESAQPSPSEEATAPQTDATSSATSTAEPASEPAVAEEPAAAKAEEVSGEQVLAAAKKLLGTGPEGESKLKKCLAATGAPTVGTCPTEKRADLLAAINAELGA